MSTQAHSRIDILISELGHDSTSNAAVTLANKMAENGLHTRLIVIGDEAELPIKFHENLELKFLEITRRNNFLGNILYFTSVYFILSVYLAKEHSRRLFIWGNELTIMAVILRITLMLQYKLIGVNVINILARFEETNPILRKILTWFNASLLKDAEFIIAQSSGMAEDLKNIYKIPENKLSIIYPPLQKEFFETQNSDNKQQRILFIGEFSSSKNPILALEIFNNLNSQSATLKFIGEGELEENLHEKIAELGLQTRVSITDWQNDNIASLSNADILIMTSKYENFGIILAEAISCGVPVIAFDCHSGPSEIIIDGVNGYLIPEGNNDLFARKLNQALTKDWDYNKIRETATKFHPDFLIKHYAEIIKKISV